MTSPNQTSIIIPTYNESQNIRNLLDNISKNLPDHNTEAIIVDDDSPDGTASIVEKYTESMKKLDNFSISLVRRTKERGLSSAILQGIEKATGKLIVVMDSDLSHPPHLIPKMISILKQKRCDIVVASRYISGGGVTDWSFKRRIISKGATKIARTGLNIDTRDPMSGFFAFKKQILNGVQFDAIGYKILLEMLVKIRGVTIQEIPYTFSDRKKGQSKLGVSTIFDYCKSVCRLYRYGKQQRDTEKRVSVRFFSKAARFFTVGTSGIGANYITSLLFSLSFDFWYLHATIMGIAISITSNFFLNKYWTFEDHDFAPKHTAIQYGKFGGFSSIGALIQLGMVFYLVDEVGLSYPLSLVFAVGTAAFSNFILNKKWTFKEKVWS